MTTDRFTKEQREWIDWALGSIDSSTNCEAADYACDQDCTLEQAERRLTAADCLRLDGDTLTLPPPSPAADEMVSDLGYWLVTKAPDITEDAWDLSAQKKAASKRAALAAWEKVEAAYIASGGNIIDEIVFCQGWERPTVE